jgi:hypothetical protein
MFINFGIIPTHTLFQFWRLTCRFSSLFCSVTLIQSDHVIDQICLIHDCSIGDCTVTESEIRTIVDREAVTKVKFTYVHDLNHKNYLVNKFYLGESHKY